MFCKINGATFLYCVLCMCLWQCKVPFNLMRTIMTTAVDTNGDLEREEMNPLPTDKLYMRPHGLTWFPRLSLCCRRHPGPLRDTGVRLLQLELGEGAHQPQRHRALLWRQGQAAPLLRHLEERVRRCGGGQAGLLAGRRQLLRQVGLSVCLRPPGGSSERLMGGLLRCELCVEFSSGWIVMGWRGREPDALSGSLAACRQLSIVSRHPPAPTPYPPPPGLNVLLRVFLLVGFSSWQRFSVCFFPRYDSSKIKLL